MNQTEFDATVAKLRPRLRRIAAHVVGWSDADDVVQNALLDASRDASLTTENAETYLVQRTMNDAQNYAAGLARAASTGAHLEVTQKFEAQRPGDAEDTALTQLSVRGALAALPADICAAVWAVFAEGVSWRDAATEAGVPVKTLHNRVAKWLPYLREQLGGTKTSSSRYDIHGGDSE